MTPRAPHTSGQTQRRPWGRAILARTLVLCLVWLVLVEGGVDYLAYGLIAVPLAVAVSCHLSPPGPRTRPAPGRVAGTLSLLGWALGRMVAGGLDVARRAVSRPVDIDPVVVEVPTHLRGPGLSFAVGLFNLMPGTVVQDLDGDVARVHCLSADLDPQGAWAELERRVARAAGLPHP